MDYLTVNRKKLEDVLERVFSFRGKDGQNAKKMVMNEDETIP